MSSTRQKIICSLLIVLIANVAFAQSVKERLRKARMEEERQATGEQGETEDENLGQEKMSPEMEKAWQKFRDQQKKKGFCVDDKDCENGQLCEKSSKKCMDPVLIEKKRETARMEAEERSQHEKEAFKSMLQAKGMCINDNDCTDNLKCSLLTRKCVDADTWQKDKNEVQRGMSRKVQELYKN